MYYKNMQEQNQDALQKHPCKGHAKHAIKDGNTEKIKTMCHRQKPKENMQTFFF